MSLKERVYSILIVSATDSFTSAFTGISSKNQIFSTSQCYQYQCRKKVLAEKTYDFVIINAPLPDDMGTRFCNRCLYQKTDCRSSFSKNDLHEEIHDKVVEYGIFTLSKPVSKPTMLYALSWLESARERLKQFEKKSSSIEQKMAEIRLVNKAKWLLINELKFTEPEAHHYIENKL